MTTLTDKEMIKEIKERIGSLDVRDNIERRAYEIALASLEAEPVSQAYNLPELIEGMEVSIDVSTCDADLGNRYFGTVTEALELDTAKNGYILLVQDAEPNFDVNGNSPVTPDGLSTVCAEAYQVVGVMADALGVFGDAAVQKVLDNLSQQKLVHRDVLPFSLPVTPDGWISCSERMPVIGELNWRTSFPLLVTCEIGVIPAYYGFVSVNGNRHYGFMESLKYGDDNGNHPQTNEYGLISNVTHWMPLPERRRRLTVANLQLAVNGEYFDQMKSGEKTEEYRLCNDYWNKRLVNRKYDRLIITKGYPKRDDSSRRIDVPYDGYEIKTITHPHFGDKPVKVFAIKVNIDG